MGLVPANLTLREVRVMFGNHTIRWNGHLACWESKETETTANAA
jgi:hypothetical protein